MRRADRLFQIVQLLRRSRATTAADLARELQVSVRTIYRDVEDLGRSGVPILGEAGVGYALPNHFELPPLMFAAAEVEALAVGARMVQSWGDEDLARAARSALSPIENVLPESLAERLAQSRLFAPGFHVPQAQQATLQQTRQALENGRVLSLSYADTGGRATRRDVRPLGLFYWGRTWTLVAWCELRGDFRSFRLDRIAALDDRGRTFAEEPGKRLEDFLARVRGEVDEGPASAATAAPGAGRGVGPEPVPDEKAARKAFQQLGSIGPRMADDLIRLGFRHVDELRGLDARELWRRMGELDGTPHDPCVEDTFRCAIAQAEDPDLPAEWRKWHNWTPLRGQPPGTLPKGLQRRRRGSGSGSERGRKR